MATGQRETEQWSSIPVLRVLLLFKTAERDRQLFSTIYYSFVYSYWFVPDAPNYKTKSERTHIVLFCFVAEFQLVTTIHLHLSSRYHCFHVAESLVFLPAEIHKQPSLETFKKRLKNPSLFNKAYQLQAQPQQSTFLVLYLICFFVYHILCFVCFTLLSVLGYPESRYTN